MATPPLHAKALVRRGLNLVAMTTQVVACTPTPRHLTPEQPVHTPQTPPLSGPSLGVPIWESGGYCPVFVRVSLPQFGYWKCKHCLDEAFRQ